MRDTTELAALGSYSRTLQRLQEQMRTGPSSEHLEVAAAHLNGQAGREFRRAVSATERRRLGTFFTSSELRARVVRPHRRVISAGGMVLDPACGFGDLLLAAADVIPSNWEPHRRIDHLVTHLHGRDLLSPLVGIAAQRLDLWAQAALGTSTVNGTIEPSRRPLSYGIATGDALDGTVDWSAYSLVLLNPPYTSTRLDPKRSWAGGKVTQAAPFTLDVLQKLDLGTSMAAVLPDVLRTGSRYERWRQEIERVSEVKCIDVYGKFDRWTDVDVFVLHLKRRRTAPSLTVRPVQRGNTEPLLARVLLAEHEERPTVSAARSDTRVDERLGANVPEPSGVGAGWWGRDDSTDGVLQDIAKISAGDVVPHRHLNAEFSPPTGRFAREVRYLTVHNLPIDGELVRSPDTVRFHGRTHQGPFVVLRRTSAPSGNTGIPRLRPSIYFGSDAVAVENHLIVVESRTVDPRALAQALTSPAVTDWLDHRLRLRHLTVTALRQMPISLLGMGANDG